MNTKSERTICLSGGHLSPALATSEAFVQEYPQVHRLFIGRAVAFHGDTIHSQELDIMKKAGCRVFSIHARRISYSSPFSLFQFIAGIREAVSILKKNPCDLIVSFGGYVGLTVSLAGFLLRIPVVTHEQTHELGRANKCIALFARKIFVTYERTIGTANKKNVIISGFPLRKEILSPVSTCSFLSTPKVPLLYITGGTTGAVSMNTLIFPHIPELIKEFIVVHQTGAPSTQQALEVKNTLRPDVRDRYIQYPYIESADAGWLLHHAKLVIARTGANTVWELAFLGIPAVLLPLPWSSGGEQQKNAEWLAAHGGSVIVHQESTSRESLSDQIKKVLANYDVYAKNAKIFSQKIPRDGAQKLVTGIWSVLS